MFGVTALELLVLAVLLGALAVWLGYLLLRTAVSRGVQDAHRKLDAERTGASDMTKSRDTT